MGSRTSITYPNKFLWRGLEFRRERCLEYWTLIFSNHNYYAKWDGNENGFLVREFRDFYEFLQNECEKQDLKYFAETRRIRVPKIGRYGYLQPKLQLEAPFGFDWRNAEKKIYNLSEKYSLQDVWLDHNVGFLDGEFKIFDFSLSDE